MRIPAEGMLLRIVIGESDKHERFCRRSTAWSQKDLTVEPARIILYRSPHHSRG